MRIKMFNKPKFTIYSWIELSAGASVIGGLVFSFYPV